MTNSEKVSALALDCGFFRAGVVPVGSIVFDRAFRKACEQNTCGNYGKCWTCPPDAGDIDELIAKAKRYTYALVYQSVSALEDSFDIEGMTAAAVRHNEMTRELIQKSAPLWEGEFLHLSAGGCRLCPRCAKRDELPCRHPDEALSSLETYGVAVSQLAELAGMKYINGVNTVTYFGACFFNGLKD